MLCLITECLSSLVSKSSWKGEVKRSKLGGVDLPWLWWAVGSGCPSSQATCSSPVVGTVFILCIRLPPGNKKGLTQTTMISALCSAKRKRKTALCFQPRDLFCLIFLGERCLPTFPLPGTRSLAEFIFSTLQEMRLLGLLPWNQKTNSVSLVGVGAWLLNLLCFFQRFEFWSKSVWGKDAPMYLWLKHPAQSCQCEQISYVGSHLHFSGKREILRAV